MEKGDLQCVLIGQNIKIYADLVNYMQGIESNIRFKQVNAKKVDVINELKKINSASLIFVSDQVNFSFELLSDLVWQNASDSTIVILTKKTQSIPLKTPFNNTDFSKVYFDNKNNEIFLHLQFLIKTARIKSEFRRCKNLLGVSEKRCQWLVDSSREAVAFISRDIHLYANRAYLKLFGIDSVQEIRSISVKDLILNDERLLFDDFLKSQLKITDMNRSLILSMKKKNGVILRTNTYLIPSVYRGRKCFQLWVRAMRASYDLEDESLSLNKDIPEAITANKFTQETITTNPFQVLYTKRSTSTLPQNKTVKKKMYSPAKLLKGIIKREEAVISTQMLVRLKTAEFRYDPYSSHHLLTLKVPVAQKNGIDDLLLERTGSQAQCSMFWDKVKLTRLLQSLIKKKSLNTNLLVRLSGASIADKSFIDWFVPGLDRIGEKSANLTFLLPSQTDEKQRKLTITLVKKLRAYNCKIALDNFIVDSESVALLKQLIPDYVRLSLPWTRQIHGNDRKEIGLSRVIRQLESKDIKVIAPCSYSVDMKKLFILSGASFCQERTTSKA